MAFNTTKSLFDWLPASVGVLVLDELDVLLPAKKFTGKKFFRFQDDGMHPAEALVKTIARRCSRPDLQVVAASATLDKATSRKLERLLRASKVLRVSGIPIPTVRPADAPGAPSPSSAERVTLVPGVIQHRVVSLENTKPGVPEERSDPLKALRAAALGLGKIDSSKGGAALVFVCSSSGLKVRVVTRELKRLGFDAKGLTDALWPDSARSVKSRSPRPRGRRKTHSEAAEAVPVEAGDGAAVATGSDAAAAETTAAPASSSVTLERHALLNERLARGSSDDLPLLIVTDQAMTRGLHLDNIRAVFILGGPANPDTYLHLAGRTGRWPRVEGTVVTIARKPDIAKLRSWAATLGGVKFAAMDLAAEPEV